MATREILSIAVDVGPSMCAGGGARRSAALLVATAALQQKLLYASRDEVALLPCLHKLHAGCVAPWLRISLTCPICKTKVS